MIVLGIDTSAYANAVGITNGDKVLADNLYEARTDALEQIVANIDATLKGAGLKLADVDGIGVGLGPGSWTGIRVGVTVGKMLAFATGKPVAGMPTLEALAYAVRNEASHVVAVIPAGTGDTVYAACYDFKNGLPVRQGDYYVGGVQGLTGVLKESSVLVGEGVEANVKIIRGEIEVKTIEARPGGAAVACLAAARLARGESDDTLALAPLYLKESTAKAFVNRYVTRTKGI
jgi:tRNA threonylcarbamoyladenosine biosynthesis protein TsaB